MTTEPTLESEFARALVRAARTFHDATVEEGGGPLPSEMHEAIGVCLRVALALDPCAFAVAIPAPAAVAPPIEQEGSKGKGKGKARKAAGGEPRQRAARGLPPCKGGGRHKWNKLGWCSVADCTVHKSGKTQTEIPGAAGAEGSTAKTPVDRIDGETEGGAE